MDHDFFRKLNKRESKHFLENYLSESEAGFNKLSTQLLTDKIDFSFSYDTLPEMMEWFSGKMVKFRDMPDNSLPEWISSTEDYRRSLYHFDDYSNILILRASWYWGECFVRNSKREWDTGRSAQYKNQPVIRGFYSNLEMAPFDLVTNIVRNFTEGDNKEATRNCICYWINFVV